MSWKKELGQLTFGMFAQGGDALTPKLESFIEKAIIEGRIEILQKCLHPSVQANEGIKFRAEQCLESEKRELEQLKKQAI